MRIAGIMELDKGYTKENGWTLHGTGEMWMLPDVKRAEGKR